MKGLSDSAPEPTCWELSPVGVASPQTPEALCQVPAASLGADTETRSRLTPLTSRIRGRCQLLSYVRESSTAPPASRVTLSRASLQAGRGAAYRRLGAGTVYRARISAGSGENTASSCGPSPPCTPVGKSWVCWLLMRPMTRLLRSTY